MSSDTSDEIIDHLSAALSELEQAREKANLGTSMMLNSVIEDVRNLRTRFENINDN